MKTGVFRIPREPGLPLAGYIEPYETFFVDGREGTDRWGRDRSKVLACGTGFGDREYVCPAYLEESCPGNRGKGLRVAADFKTKCDLTCGECGGGGRTQTMAYCGWERGAGPFKAAMGEMGGSLRLDRDRYRCEPSAPFPDWGTTFMPSVEWGAKDWMPRLRAANGGQDFPWIATTVRTASPGLTKDGAPLRERLGNYTGKIIVHGLVKDDVLDDVWEYRHRLFKWNVDQGVDVMVTPQFSYYDEEPNCMVVYNTNRIFQWFIEAREAGFPHVGLDWPPGNMEWIRQEYLDFALRNEVKLLCPSFQTLRSRDGLSAAFVKDLRRLHEELPLDVSFLMFGLGTATGFAQANLCLPGRNICFASSDPFARAAFFRHVGGDLAPGRVTRAMKDRMTAAEIAAKIQEFKGDAFAHNVLHYAKITRKVKEAGARREQRRAQAAR